MITGIIIGLFAGFVLGFFTAAIMAVAANADRRAEPERTDIESTSRRTGAA